MRVLIACEFSGVVRRAFRALGHDAWSCDLLPAEDGSPYHEQGDCLELISFGYPHWDLLIAHPPCTYLSRSGWHWVNRPDCTTLPLKGEPRRKAAAEAADFFRSLLDAPIERIAVENPEPISHVKLPPPSQTIHPFWFGEPEFKATCLWLKGLPALRTTNLLIPPEKGTPEWKSWNRVHRASPGPDRWKERSRTLAGIAEAMANQWGASNNEAPPYSSVHAVDR